MKEFLSQQGISYESRDVKANPAYMDELSRLGASTIPVVKIDDRLVIGERPNQLTEVLKEKGML